MTIAQRELKTEKRRAKVGDRVVGNISGRIYEVKYVDEIGVYQENRHSLVAYHDQYEVIIESDTEGLHKEIEILRAEREDARKKLKTLGDATVDYRARIQRQEAAIKSLQTENRGMEFEITSLRAVAQEDWKAKYEQLQKENEELSEQWKNATDKADELQAKMLDWKAKYEQEHLDHLEAKAIIEETRKNLLAGWEDDSEGLNVTRHALAHAEQNNGRLTAHARELEQRNKQLEKHLEDLQNARMNINDRWAQSDEKFQAELARDRKLIGALMEYIQEG